ncbi:unnamed protein product [Ectocarpus sp. 8 AP-2014]
MDHQRPISFSTVAQAAIDLRSPPACPSPILPGAAGAKMQASAEHLEAITAGGGLMR